MDHKTQFQFFKKETLDRVFLKLLNWNKIFQISTSFSVSTCPLASWLFGKSPTWSLKVRVSSARVSLQAATLWPINGFL